VGGGDCASTPLYGAEADAQDENVARYDPNPSAGFYTIGKLAATGSRWHTGRRQARLGSDSW